MLTTSLVPYPAHCPRQAQTPRHNPRNHSRCPTQDRSLYSATVMGYNVHVPEAYDYLMRHLDRMATPYLFVGSGISRRYANLPDWEGFLRDLSKHLKRPFDYYRGRASKDLPKVASIIADDFYEIWWDKAEFSESRNKFGKMVDDRSLPLKIEISNKFEAAIDDLVIPAALEDEFELFKRVTVDGIISTNYDRLLSVAFPEFAVYTGQDELLFADPHGIAEIYQIHGSSTRPSTLVLTEDDYREFGERDVYLAAKLMTIFVEHPVIFLGYSMTDRNILQILKAILRALRNKGQDYLKERLIFVRWEDCGAVQVAPRTIQADEATLDVTEILVPQFREIFRALASRERAIPASMLRHLKSQVYELVKSNDPNGRLAMSTDIESPNDELKIVFGVAAKMTAKGLVGLTRFDLFDDVLGNPDRELPAEAVINEALPSPGFRKNMYVPYWKYLRNGDMLRSDGSLKEGIEVPDRIIFYMKREQGTLGARRCCNEVSMGGLLDSKGLEGVLKNPWDLVDVTRDVEGLRRFLIENKELRIEGRTSTCYAKLVVVYDWLMFGPPGLATGSADI